MLNINKIVHEVVNSKQCACNTDKYLIHFNSYKDMDVYLCTKCNLKLNKGKK